MPFIVFRILFLGSTILELYATINKPIVLKTYNQSNTEQLRSAVKIRHNDKCVKCRFFKVPGDRPALLSMPNITLFNIIKSYK